MIIIPLSIMAKDRTPLVVFCKNKLTEFGQGILPAVNNFSVTASSAELFIVFLLFTVFTFITAVGAKGRGYGRRVQGATVTGGLNVYIIHKV